MSNTKYVPMTDDEITEATSVAKSDLLHEPTKYCWRVVEQAVLARIEQQGLVIVPVTERMMNRNEAIERALNDALAFISKEYRCEKSIAINGEFVSKEAKAVRDSMIEALAMPKADAEPVACTYPSCQVTSGCVGSCKSPQYVSAPKADAERVLIFWDGSKYSFYTESLEMGEQIVKHLPNSNDFTATALSPQADAERVALIVGLDYALGHITHIPVSHDLLRDIRAYLKGGA